MSVRELVPGVGIVRERRLSYVTENLIPGARIHEEKLIREGGREFRVWDPLSSKICSAMHKGIVCVPKPGDAVLYLGASTGTTVSYISDIVGREGIVFAVEFAGRVCRELVYLAKKRGNIAPILADAGQVDTFSSRVCQVDWLFQDIAQRNQMQIFLKNVEAFLAPGARCAIAVKARSIDSTKNPETVFGQVKHELMNSNMVKIISQTTLDPFQKDHLFVVCEKR